MYKRQVHVLLGQAGERVEVVVEIPHGDAWLPTLAGVSYPAGRFEREMHDLYGIDVYKRQALIHVGAGTDRLLAIVLPITMGIVALTIGLGLLTFVKAYGIGFLARPRTAAAADAREAGVTMRSALVVGSLLVVGLGFVPGPLVSALAGAVAAQGVATLDGAGLSLPAIGVVLHPAALALLAGAILVPLLSLIHI